METPVTPDRILQLSFGFWSAKAALSAVELGLFTELAKSPADAATLTRKLGLHERGALDFFDTLVALGLLQREHGIYSNSVEASTYLDRAKPTYVGGILEMSNARLWSAWGSLTTALRTGQPQNEVKEGNTFEVLYSDPKRLRLFLEGMTGISLPTAKAMASKFSWRDYKSFVDVGAAQGALPTQIALAHPHLRGFGFDLPAVKPVFEEYVASFNLQDRVSFLSGDFFKDALPQADVIVMGHILHDWDLKTKRQLLAKAYDALPRGGALIVYEAMIDDDRSKNAFGLLMSLNMLIETPGGFDFTGADCQGWMREAGFRETWVEPLCGADSMAVAIK